MTPRATGLHSGHRPRRRGIALMEAMIAILVLSMGALGYAALQIKGLSASSSSMWRSKAGNLAYEMADRMRANRAGAVAGAYNALGAPQTITDWSSGCALRIPAAFDPDQLRRLLDVLGVRP